MPDSAFAIAHVLLDADMAAPAWTNLGDWLAKPTGSEAYALAAERLAQRVGQAAITGPNQSVADLGCGHGASLLLWQQHFSAAHVIGVERQQACVDAWHRRIDVSQNIHMARGRFDRLPVSDAVQQHLPESACDAVVCVDAAYHADSLAAFVAVAHTLLKSSGRLAFTSVLKGDALSAASRVSQVVATHLSGIPPASFVTEQTLCQVLAMQGFRDIRVEILDQEVLQGFADFVRHRSAQLPRSARFSSGWLKIAATASLCRYWHRTRGAHYALISAVRT